MSLRSRAGFTLVELLVVVAIIALVLALIGSAVSRVQHAANVMRSASNFKQLGIAIHNFHGDYSRLPAAAEAPDGKGAMSWRVSLLPYLG